MARFNYNTHSELLKDIKLFAVQEDAKINEVLDIAFLTMLDLLKEGNFDFKYLSEKYKEKYKGVEE